jgi:hypothetical protein
LRAARSLRTTSGRPRQWRVRACVSSYTDDRFLERWIQPLTNGGLFMVALVGLLGGRPFTLDYAREAVDAETARLPGFLYINRIITWIWVGAFAVMTVSALLPPIFEGDATLKDNGSTLSIVGYWVMPYTVLGLAVCSPPGSRTGSPRTWTRPHVNRRRWRPGRRSRFRRPAPAG